MNISRKELGQRGEDLAVDYLQSLGYKIFCRNYRCRYGEIDIIAEEGGDLVFIEVRAKRSARFGTALESVNYRKQAKIKSIALVYIAAAGIKNENYRFDVVAIYYKSGWEAEVNLIRNAF